MLDTDDRERLLAQFEGLIVSTSRMYAQRVRLEEEDLAQELRVKVWYALARYDPARSRLSLERYIFGIVTNRMFDFKRRAVRERARREREGVSFGYIEDAGHNGYSGAEFCAAFHFADHDTVYGRIDEGKFVLPATLTDLEVRLLVVLMFGFSKAEAALRLGLSRKEADSLLSALRQKLADWKPSQRANSSQVVVLAEAA